MSASPIPFPHLFRLNTIPDSSGTSLVSLFVPKDDTHSPDELFLQIRQFTDNTAKAVAGVIFMVRGQEEALQLWNDLREYEWRTTVTADVPPEIVNHRVAADLLPEGQSYWQEINLNDIPPEPVDTAPEKIPFRILSMRPWTLFGILIGFVMVMNLFR